MSESSVNSPNSYPNLNVTETNNSDISVTANVTSVEITDPNLSPQLNLTISDYPSLTIIPSPEIVIGGGGGGGPGGQGVPGEQGPRGNTGPQGPTGQGYSGAFISGGTLYLNPYILGVVQPPVGIGQVSGGSESIWLNTDPILTTVGGLAAGSTLTGLNAIQILEEMLYPYQPVSFNSFTVNLGASTLDLNQPISAGVYSSSWNTSGPNANWVAGSVSVSSSVGGSLVSGLNYNSDPVSITHPEYKYTTPTTVTFTLSGQQLEGSNPQTTQSYSWKHRVYWGSSTSTSITNFTGFSSEFADSSPTTTRSFTGDGSTPKYYYFVIPSSFANYVKFYQGVSEAAFDPAVTISVTNAYGLSVSYKYYKSSVTSVGNALIYPSLT